MNIIKLKTYTAILATIFFTTCFWETADHTNIFDPDTPNSAPTAVTFDYTCAKTIEKDSIKLEWETSPDFDFSMYALYASTTSGFAPGADNLIYSSTNKNDTVYTHTGLSTLTDYYFVLRICDDGGLFTSSSELRIRTAPDTFSFNNTTYPYYDRFIIAAQGDPAEQQVHDVAAEYSGTDDFPFFYVTVSGQNDYYITRVNAKGTEGRTFVADPTDGMNDIIYRYNGDGVDTDGSNDEIMTETIFYIEAQQDIYFIDRKPSHSQQLTLNYIAGNLLCPAQAGANVPNASSTGNISPEGLFDFAFSSDYSKAYIIGDDQYSDPPTKGAYIKMYDFAPATRAFTNEQEFNVYTKSSGALFVGSSIAIASDGIIVAGEASNNIAKFSNGSSDLGTMSWITGTSGSDNGRFNSPTGVQVDSQGYIYVADSGNSRIQVFDSSGNFVSKFGRPGTDLYGFNGMKRIRIFQLNADITGGDDTPETDVEVLIVTVKTGFIIYKLREL